MNKESKIYIAGHNGLVGSAIKRELEKQGYSNLIFKTHKELDLERQNEVEEFFEMEKPEYVFLAAARVGGIMANKTFPAEFIYSNLAVELNVIHSAYKFAVKKLLFLGSSCIYPRLASQPMKEEYLLSSPLEPTNEAYAIAKIAGLKMCKFYNEQYGTNFISVQPTNLYGQNDNYDLNNSHVLPALIRKIFLAKQLEDSNYKNIYKDLSYWNDLEKISENPAEEVLLGELCKFGIVKTRKRVELILWGSGKPKREFLHVDDLSKAVVLLMKKFNYSDIGELINIGCGNDISIKELAMSVKEIVGFKGKIKWDSSKPDGTPRKLLDIEKMKKFGWLPEISLNEGIKRTLEDYKKKFR